MKPWVKFAILVVAIVGTLAWLAASGVSESKTYYKTISEIATLTDTAKTSRLRVGGDVESGSIVRNGGEVRFTMTCVAKNGICSEPGKAATDASKGGEVMRLKVLYTGTEPLPDTFRDGSQALADGKLLPDGTLQASKIQAKCASKYESKPQYRTPASPSRASL
jgi:cytochrome c-type biogenesis protein CcmE